MDDRQLRHHIVNELEFEPSIDAANIGVAVSEGVVTLTGYVSSYAEKVAAEQAVRRVKGVRAIAEELEVRYPNDENTGDEEIAKRVLSILKWDTRIPRGAVEITVRKGWVTLAGEVNWQYQRKAAEDAVRKLSGITGVTNTLSIKPIVAESDIKKKIEDALNRHAEVEARDVRIRIVDGNTVSLEGKVDSWSEREAIENAAWSVPGVQSVEDRLVIGR